MARIIPFPGRKAVTRKRARKPSSATLTDVAGKQLAAATEALKAAAAAAERGDLVMAMENHHRAGELLNTLRALSS